MLPPVQICKCYLNLWRLDLKQSQLTAFSFCSKVYYIPLSAYNTYCTTHLSAASPSLANLRLRCRSIHITLLKPAAMKVVTLQRDLHSPKLLEDGGKGTARGRQVDTDFGKDNMKL